jgi:hypothetical protein
MQQNSAICSVAAIVWMDINVPDIPESTASGFGGLLANIGM